MSKQIPIIAWEILPQELKQQYSAAIGQIPHKKDEEHLPLWQAEKIKIDNEYLKYIQTMFQSLLIANLNIVHCNNFSAFTETGGKYVLNDASAQRLMWESILKDPKYHRLQDY